jgi:deazaflavin-dependent oxidoreductase (nitroreductase family)
LQSSAPARDHDSIFSDGALAKITIKIPDAGVRFSGRLQAWLYKISKGRIGGRFGRGPVLVLTTTGRKTGRPRQTTVLYEKDGHVFIVVGSNTGSERPPAWALNLVAQPEAESLVRGKRIPVRATEAPDTERERLRQMMDRRYRGFEAYRARTKRELKIFVLDPL